MPVRYESITSFLSVAQWSQDVILKIKACRHMLVAALGPCASNHVQYTYTTNVSLIVVVCEALGALRRTVGRGRPTPPMLMYHVLEERAWDAVLVTPIPSADKYAMCLSARRTCGT